MSTSTTTRGRAGRPHPLPPGLPAWLAPWHQRAATLAERLPSTPPSWAAAHTLNHLLLPRLPADAIAALHGRVVALELSDFGLRLRLRLGETGFAPAGDSAPVALRIAATSPGWLRLVRGEDDPDRLFFDRVLVMEGDTELGLVLKHALDAIGPLWPARRR